MDTWAQTLQKLIQQHTNGNKAKFARLTGVDVRTLTRWQRGQVGASEEKVHQIAAVLGVQASDLLRSTITTPLEPSHLAPGATSVSIEEYEAVVRQLLDCEAKLREAYALIDGNS